MLVISCNEMYYIVLQFHYMSLQCGGFAEGSAGFEAVMVTWTDTGRTQWQPPRGSLSHWPWMCPSSTYPLRRNPAFLPMVLKLTCLSGRVPCMPVTVISRDQAAQLITRPAYDRFKVFAGSIATLLVPWWSLTVT